MAKLKVFISYIKLGIIYKGANNNNKMFLILFLGVLLRKYNNNVRNIVLLKLNDCIMPLSP